MARHLTETDLDLITAHIQNNIASALAAIRINRNDPIVTTEPPPTDSYFNYFKAHGYRCPAIFVIDDGMDFRQQEKNANHINALSSINVTVKVEDRKKELLVIKALRYQAALHQLLDQTPLANNDNTVKLYLRVKKIKPSGLYTYGNSEEDDSASFFYEYMLELAVEHVENF